jgi:hypothetical protein
LSDIIINEILKLLQINYLARKVDVLFNFPSRSHRTCNITYGKTMYCSRTDTPSTRNRKNERRMNGNVLMSNRIIWRTDLPLSRLFFMNSTLGTISVFTVRVANCKATCYQIYVFVAKTRFQILPNFTPSPIPPRQMRNTVSKTDKKRNEGTVKYIYTTLFAKCNCSRH